MKGIIFKIKCFINIRGVKRVPIPNKSSKDIIFLLYGQYGDTNWKNLLIEYWSHTKCSMNDILKYHEEASHLRVDIVTQQAPDVEEISVDQLISYLNKQAI